MTPDAVRALYSRRILPTIDGVCNTLRILERFDPKFGRLKAETSSSESSKRRRLQMIGGSPVL
jgi:hypothetical protein